MTRRLVRLSLNQFWTEDCDTYGCDGGGKGLDDNLKRPIKRAYYTLATRYLRRTSQALYFQSCLELEREGQRGERVQGYDEGCRTGF